MDKARARHSEDKHPQHSALPLGDMLDANRHSHIEMKTFFVNSHVMSLSDHSWYTSVIVEQAHRIHIVVISINSRLPGAEEHSLVGTEPKLSTSSTAEMTGLRAEAFLHNLQKVLLSRGMDEFWQIKCCHILRALEVLRPMRCAICVVSTQCLPFQVHFTQYGLVQRKNQIPLPSGSCWNK